MKKILMVNYYLVIIGWCLFLNSFEILGMMFLVGGSVILLSIDKKINYWRMIGLSFLANGLVSFLLEKSSIPIYFPQLSRFIFLACLNNAIMYEYLNMLKSDFLYTVAFTIIVSIFASTILVKILPNDFYTIFTKDNLLLMIAFIFLPYLFTVSFCLLFRYFKQYQLEIRPHKSVKI